MTIAVSITSIVYIGGGTLPAFGIISYGFLFFKLRKTKLSRDKFVTSLKHFSTIPNISTVIAFAFVISHFCWVMAFLGWPPGVDAISHGLLTSILDHNHRLQRSLTPVAPSEHWFEPFGFHVMAAQLPVSFWYFSWRSHSYSCNSDNYINSVTNLFFSILFNEIYYVFCSSTIIGILYLSCGERYTVFGEMVNRILLQYSICKSLWISVSPRVYRVCISNI